MAQERYAFFPNAMTQHEVEALTAEREELTEQLSAALHELGSSAT